MKFSLYCSTSPSLKCSLNKKYVSFVGVVLFRRGYETGRKRWKQMNEIGKGKRKN